MTKRHSKKRDQILSVMKEAKTALSAGSIHTQLPKIDKVTIYRNLELFVSEGLVKAFNFGGTETLYEYQHHPHHHAVCTDCDRVIHFTAEDKKLSKLLGLTDFQVTEITVKGICNHKK
jgi:Fur family transcriptional regulator, ferric uptake regulator